MSDVVIVSRTPRDGDMIEVTVSIDTLRFTVHVPKALDESPDAPSVYRAMADAQVRRNQDTAAVIEANRSV